MMCDGQDVDKTLFLGKDKGNVYKLNYIGVVGTEGGAHLKALVKDHENKVQHLTKVFQISFFFFWSILSVCKSSRSIQQKQLLRHTTLHPI